MSGKNKIQPHRIALVQADSIAQELGIEAGDLLLSVNGQPIEDVFDYHYLMNDEFVTVLVQKQDGEEWEIEIEKDYEEDIGLQFEESLMDNYRSCKNRCIFCFIDQMPKGMRETLYFKDDDARLSFLQGNYITLTNMTAHDIDRICLYKLSPINISVHTTNPELRKKMLHNRFAGDVLEKMRRFAEAGITMNAQIVLCKGWNDGAELDRTIEELSGLLPRLQSVSVVPIGLTKFREGLTPLEPFRKEEAAVVIDQIEAWQLKLYKQAGTYCVFAADEWYLKAERPFPPEEAYEGYPQIENGVGMVRSLLTEFEAGLEELLTDTPLAVCARDLSRGLTAVSPQQKLPLPNGRKTRSVSIATGLLAAPLMETLSERLCRCFEGLSVRVYAIKNQFFGEEITVAGLLTGQDLRTALSGQPLGETLLLPNAMIKEPEAVFLDDITVKDMEKALQIAIHVVQSDGISLIDAILNE